MELWGIDASPAFTRADGKHSTISRTLQSGAGAIDGGGAAGYNEKTQKYELSPFFDQGLCMFADINQDYPIDQSLEYCLEKIEAKPFSSDFDIQLDAAEELYGIQIGFQFTFKDIQIYLQKNSENYPREVVRRVEQLLRRQMRKYGYLMKK